MKFDKKKKIIHRYPNERSGTYESGTLSPSHSDFDYSFRKNYWSLVRNFLTSIFSKTLEKHVFSLFSIKVHIKVYPHKQYYWNPFFICRKVPWDYQNRRASRSEESKARRTQRARERDVAVLVYLLHSTLGWFLSRL